jgi:hypothetical protein
VKKLLFLQPKVVVRFVLPRDQEPLGLAARQRGARIGPAKAHVFAAERIHGDDTTVPVLAKGDSQRRLTRDNSPQPQLRQLSQLGI